MWPGEELERKARFFCALAQKNAPKIFCLLIVSLLEEIENCLAGLLREWGKVG
jgi:hypothetical protein